MDHKYNQEYPYRGGQGDLATEERGGEVITEAQGWNDVWMGSRAKESRQPLICYSSFWKLIQDSELR